MLKSAVVGWYGKLILGVFLFKIFMWLCKVFVAACGMQDLLVSPFKLLVAVCGI